MAACLIEFTGTGLGHFSYTWDDISYTIRTSGGPFYVDDTITDLTYTPLTGDLNPTSACIDITFAAMTYFKLSWRDLAAVDHQIVGIQFNNEEMIPFNEYINFPNANIALVRAINGAVDDRFKVVGYRNLSSVVNGVRLYHGDYILRTIGGTEVNFVVVNDDEDNLLVSGELFSDEVIPPADYTEVSLCYPPPPIPD